MLMLFILFYNWNWVQKTHPIQYISFSEVQRTTQTHLYTEKVRISLINNIQFPIQLRCVFWNFRCFPKTLKLITLKAVLREYHRKYSEKKIHRNKKMYLYTAYEYILSYSNTNLVYLTEICNHLKTTNMPKRENDRQKKRTNNTT